MYTFYTKPVYLKKSISLLQMANCRKPPLPVVIVIARLGAAETCSAGMRTRSAGASLGTPSAGSQAQAVLNGSTGVEGRTG